MARRGSRAVSKTRNTKASKSTRRQKTSVSKSPMTRSRKVTPNKSPARPKKSQKSKNSTSRTPKRKTTPKKKTSQKKDQRIDAMAIADEILMDMPRSGNKHAARAERALSKSPVRATKQKGSHRNFFTVKEDWLILEYIKSHPDQKISAISSYIAADLQGRSKESIRDRIKRYLSKISAGDKRKIEFAAKVIFTIFLANFTKEKKFCIKFFFFNFFLFLYFFILLNF